MHTSRTAPNHRTLTSVAARRSSTKPSETAGALSSIRPAKLRATPSNDLPSKDSMLEALGASHMPLVVRSKDAEAPLTKRLLAEDSMIVNVQRTLCQNGLRAQQEWRTENSHISQLTRNVFNSVLRSISERAPNGDDLVVSGGMTSSNGEANNAQLQLELAYMQTAIIDHALMNLQALETLHDMTQLAAEKRQGAERSREVLKELQELTESENSRQKELGACESFAVKILTKPSRDEMDRSESSSRNQINFLEQEISRQSELHKARINQINQTTNQLTELIESLKATQASIAAATTQLERGDPEKDEILTLGKHKGKTYCQIGDEDPSYCSWVVSLDAPSGPLSKFRDYLQKYNNSGSSKESSKPVDRSSLDSLLDSCNEFALGGSQPPPRKKSRLSQWIEADLTLDDPLLAAEECTNITEPTKSQQLNEVNGSIVLEICSNEHFRIQIEKSPDKKGSAAKLSTYLSTELFSFVLEFVDRSARRNSGTQNLMIHADKMTQFVSALRERWKLPEGVQSIPLFVLRCFQAFRANLSPRSLQKSGPRLLLDTQSPRTLKASQNLDQSLGAELVRELKPFQLEGIKFGLKKNGRCLIGDEMGLGKTLQALGIIAVYANEWPALIICPSSIRFQWRDQAKRWLRHCFKNPDNELIVVQNGKTKLSSQARLIIVSYELLCKLTALQSGIKVIVCDESHYLKSTLAKRSQTIVPMLQAANRAILLSGTPALNKPCELFQQLNSLLPDFSTYDEFARRYCFRRKNLWSHKMEYFSYRLADELNLLLTATVMIRRFKKDVQKELPSKLRSKIPMEISSSAMREIESMMGQLNHKHGGFEENFVRNGTNTNNNNDGKERPMLGQLFKLTGEAKIEPVTEYLEYLLEVERCFLVFAHHMVVLDALESKLQSKKVSYIRIDGSTPQQTRETYVKKFQEERTVQVALLSITACGHGLNLTAASTAVFAELYWVPGQIMQAEDRCHRMGSTHETVNIHYCIAEGTLDGVVWALLNKKWNAVSSTLNGQNEEFDDDKMESLKHKEWKKVSAAIADRKNTENVKKAEPLDELESHLDDWPKEQRSQVTLTKLWSDLDS